MIRWLGWVSLTMAVLLWAAGCSNGPIVGTWKLQLPEELKKQLIKDKPNTYTEATIVFEGDRTFRMDTWAQGLKARMEGNWEQTGETLNLHIVTVNGQNAAQRGTVDQTATLSKDRKAFLMGSVTFVKQ